MANAKANFANVGINIIDGVCNEANLIFLVDELKSSIADPQELYDNYTACNGNNSDGINVYFIPTFATTGTLGVGELPGKTCVVGPAGLIATHEIGHCLGLYHTFEGSDQGEKPSLWKCDDGSGYTGYGSTWKDCSKNQFVRFHTIENADGSNNTVAGDFVPDTPGDFRMEYSNCNCLREKNTCDYQECADDCDTDYRKDLNCDDYNPDLSNFMSYTDHCWSHFSTGQGVRMRAITSAFLPEVITTSAEYRIEINETSCIKTNVAYTSMKVNNNKSLYVQNATVKLQNKIDVLPKAYLSGKNSTFTSCNSTWDGIFMHEGIGLNAATVSFQNTEVSNAIVGINTSSKSNQTFWWNTTLCADCGGNIFTDGETKFKNNGIGIHFRGSSQLNYSRINNSNFENNSTAGIVFKNSKGVYTSNNFYTGNSGAGIISLDSYFSAKESSIFDGNQTAVIMNGSYPSTTGADIQDCFMFSNWTGGIKASGSIHPSKLIISNNRIFLNNTDNINLFGNCSSTIANNAIAFSQKGIVMNNANMERNKIQCNNFQNAINNYVSNKNSFTEVLENNFDFENQFPQIFLRNATIQNEQGSPGNPAGNCFSRDNSDILQQGQSQSFRYHFYNPTASVDCQEPITPGGYVKLESEIVPKNCDGKIGPFNIIDPDGDGILNVYIPPIDTIIDGDTLTGDPDICWPCLSDSIDIWVGEWLDYDPDGDGEVGPDTYNEEFYQAYEMVDQWVNYALFLAQEYNMYDQGIAILQDLPGFRWKARQYGLYVMAQRYPAAQSLLQNLSPSNLDESYFKSIQLINLARLQSTTSYVANQSELDLLYNITYSDLPSAGYAKSLYYILTGIELDIALPDVPDGGPRSKEIAKVNPILFPNPFQNTVNLSFGNVVKEANIEITNLQGIKVGTYQLRNLADYQIDLAGKASGIYFIKIVVDKDNVFTYKVSKL